MSLTRTTSPAKAVQLLKAGSSKRLNEQKGKILLAREIRAFSLGPPQRNKTISYIRRQEEHHQRIGLLMNSRNC
jgi:hypothetical protein